RSRIDPMPSRPVVLGIVLFWVATLGWSVVREILPWFNTGEPPLQFDLEAEVGGKVINWEVYKQGERVGDGQTKIVNPKRDLAFELSNTITFTKTETGLVALKKVSDSFRVTAKGELLSYYTIMYFTLANVAGEKMEFKVGGEVHDGILTPIAKL